MGHGTILKPLGTSLPKRKVSRLTTELNNTISRIRIIKRPSCKGGKSSKNSEVTAANPAAAAPTPAPSTSTRNAPKDSRAVNNPTTPSTTARPAPTDSLPTADETAMDTLGPARLDPAKRGLHSSGESDAAAETSQPGVTGLPDPVKRSRPQPRPGSQPSGALVGPQPPDDMPPPRSNAFTVKLPVGCTADDIIDGVARIVTIQEVYCVQHMGAKNYEVTVNTRAAATTLVQFKNVRLGDQLVPLVPIGPASTSITCLFLPAAVTNEALIRSLTPYGQVVEPSVLTGTRYIQMRIKEDNSVPNYIRVAGHRAVFDYPGVRRVCRRCRQEGHISTDCTAPFCVRCGIYGLETTPCPHATTTCEVPHLYSSVAGGSQAARVAPVEPDPDDPKPLTNKPPPPTRKPETRKRGSPEWPHWEGVNEELQLSEDSDMETAAANEAKRTRSSDDTTIMPTTKKKKPQRWECPYYDTSNRTTSTVDHHENYVCVWNWTYRDTTDPTKDYSSSAHQVNEGQPVPDIKQLNLRAARRKAQRRAMRTDSAEDWTTYNRIDAVLRRHAKQLGRKSWEGICSTLQGAAGQRRVWHLLRALAHPPVNTNPLSALSIEMQKTTEELAEEFASYYAPDDPQTTDTSPGDVTPPPSNTD
ncbi:hypothetical protein HPB48_026845 [Haemaphysalis longicornis]|uniref:CCHC-type domain-containing protein n=1 Tax=Haemaphysalis longicornis TaxID=44386 RepID=A0A9J6H258_HAELO|nr:hypothetical protein HPB48_026845 [Haemaphysalis longicornis]